MFAILLLVAAIASSGAARSAPLDSLNNAATLVIYSASPNNPLAIPYFASIDGQPLKSRGEFIKGSGGFKISIKPGKHTVGYYCGFYTDWPAPATITMYFQPHQKYIFRCAGHFKATVEKG